MLKKRKNILGLILVCAMLFTMIQGQIFVYAGSYPAPDAQLMAVANATIVAGDTWVWQRTEAGGNIIWGDVDGNGVVNGADLLLLRRFFSGHDVTVAPGADVNGDGVINGADLLLLRRFFAGHDVILGPPKPPVCEIYTFERRVLELTNIERAKHGLAPLIWHDQLGTAARAHSDDMAQNNFLSHAGSDGSTPAQRIEQAGVTGLRAWGENVARGQLTPEAMVQSWMNSAGHRANILNENFTHLGVGFAEIPGTQFVTYGTQKFAAFW